MDYNEKVNQMKKYLCAGAGLTLAVVLITALTAGAASVKITGVTDNTDAYPSSIVPKYEKLEISFEVENLAAKNFYRPYDGEPIRGLAQRIGVTVDGLFLSPGKDDWDDAIVQPAFWYQPMEAEPETGFTYPIGEPMWKIRFAPTQTGTWKYRIRVQDKSVTGGQWPSNKWVETGVSTFRVQKSRPDNHGFVEVSPDDSRYFQYSDGSAFAGLGHEVNVESFVIDLENPEPYFERCEKFGIDFIRTWMCSSLITGRGTHGWDAWRNIKRLGPNHGIEGVPYGYHDFSVHIDGNNDFIYAMKDGNQPLGSWIKADKKYILRVLAKLDKVEASGPEPAGLVFKFIKSRDGFSDPGNTAQLLTEKGFTGSTGWKEFEATFTNTLGRRALAQGGTLAIGLGNVTSGDVYIDRVYLGEDLGGGQIGPNVLFKGQFNYHLYCDQIASWLYDQYFELADRHGIRVKAVILEKNDPIYERISLEDGTFITGKGGNDNFYAKPGTKVRKLHKYFWRYVAARWGYSTAVHSWELLNEGAPFNTMHHDQANALQRSIDKWDRNHMSNTSFWHSFPTDFWKNSPCEYADVHAYISTSYAPKSIKPKMHEDAAFYHLWHSRDLKSKNIGKPIVRGEAGLDFPDKQWRNPELKKDTQGVWFHNYVWSMLNAGGLYELYWWTEDLYNYDGRGRKFDHRDEFLRYRSFIEGIDLHKGGYEQWGGQVNNDALRVVGQKNTEKPAFHLWIQNKKHTWKNVVDNNPIPPQDAKLTIPGFEPGDSFQVRWWDTYTGKILRSEQVTVTNDAEIVLEVSDLTTDVAVKGIARK